MDWGFGTYWWWGEVPLVKVKEFVMHFVVTRNEQAYFAASSCVTHPKGGATYVAVALEV